MNYTINYSGARSVGHSQLTPNSIPVCGTGQRTIVLSSPSQKCQNNVSSSGSNQQSNYPMMMQVGSSNPVFYTYQSSDNVVKSAISNTANDSVSSGNAGIGPVVLSPISPVASGLNLHSSSSSPTLPSVNIRVENKPLAPCSLGEVFNIQAVNQIPNPGQMIHSNPATVASNLAVNQPVINPGTPSTTDLAMIVSSLNAAGLQIVDSSCGNIETVAIALPVMNNLHTPSVQVVDNNTEKTMALSIPNGNLSMENMYKFVDADRNVRVLTHTTSSSNDTHDNTGNSMPVMQSVSPLKTETSR